jgi:hypothetical protein
VVIREPFLPSHAAGDRIHPLLRFASGLFHRGYLNHYTSHSPDRHAYLQSWVPVIAPRLDENIPGERAALLQLAVGNSA